MLLKTKTQRFTTTAPTDDNLKYCSSFLEKFQQICFEIILVEKSVGSGEKIL